MPWRVLLCKMTRDVRFEVYVVKITEYSMEFNKLTIKWGKLKKINGTCCVLCTRVATGASASETEHPLYINDNGWVHNTADCRVTMTTSPRRLSDAFATVSACEE